MKTFDVLFKTKEDVMTFVSIVSKYVFDIDLTSGRYTVDAKSILGIFSLGLNKLLQIEIYSEKCEKLESELKPYILENKNEK